MKTIFKGWKDKPMGYKVLSIIGIMVSISVIVLSILQIIGVIKNATNIFMPLLGVLMLIQAIQTWKTNRTSAIFSLCVSIFIFIVALINIIK